MKTLGAIIKNFREEHGLSMDAFAELSGLSKGYISMLEKNVNPRTGKSITPSLDTYNSVAKALNVDLDRLLSMVDGNEEVFLQSSSLPKNVLQVKYPTKKIPLVGTIAAGEPILADENIEDYIDLDERIKADFCLRIKGYSMVNANIHDGDIIFIKKQSDVDDGQIAAVLIDDEATLKRVYKYGDSIQLRAENPSFAPINLNKENEVIILGLATYKLSKVV